MPFKLPSSNRPPVRTVFLGVVLFSAVGMVAARITKVQPGWVAPISSCILLLAAAWLVSVRLGRWWRVVLLGLIASGAEFCSLHTGVPFGHYNYTALWWPVVWLGDQRFPVLLPFAWILVAGGAFVFLSEWLSGWRRAILAALLATAIDAPMEKCMTQVFGYWRWSGGQPPPVNAMGWFVVAFVALIPAWKLPKGSSDSGLVLGIFCWFLALAGWLTGPAPEWLLLTLEGAAMFLLSLKKVKANAEPVGSPPVDKS